MSECYLLLTKTHYTIINDKIETLKKDLKKDVEDVKDIDHTFTLPNFSDCILKFTTSNIHSKTIAVRIISDFLYKELEKKYSRMRYLKLTLLIPDNVIGFIIGIEGKNINSIRDESGTRIEVYPNKDSEKFRQIEISGNPYDISKACDSIFQIEEKYANFKAENLIRNKNEKYIGRSRGRDRSNEKSYERGKYERDRSEEREKDYDRERYYERERNYDRNYDSRNYDTRNYDTRNYDTRNYDTRNYDKYRRNIRRSRSKSSPKRRNTNMVESGYYSRHHNYEIEDGLIIEDKSETPKNEINSENKKDSTTLIEEVSKVFDIKKRNIYSDIDLIFEENELEPIKKLKSNIWIELSKSYETKITEKKIIIDNKPMIIVTFSGDPTKNAAGIYQLQEEILCLKK